MKIGFIGLGNMGGPMAANLAGADHQVTGFDPAGQLPAGVILAETAAAAAGQAEVVITMLPNGSILRSVAEEILPVMTEGAVLCDCSTVDVASARAVAAQAAGAGSVFWMRRFPAGSAARPAARSPLWRVAAAAPLKRLLRSLTSWARRQCIAAKPAQVRLPRSATI